MLLFVSHLETRDMLLSDEVVIERNVYAILGYCCFAIRIRIDVAIEAVQCRAVQCSHTTLELKWEGNKIES